MLSSRVALVHQKFDLMLADQFSFADNLRLASLSSHPSLKPLSNFNRLPDFVQNFALPLNQQVNELSGGQRQLLAILMTLQKPIDVLLLDEPTAALDTTNAVMVIDFLKTLAAKSNLIVVIISHDKELIDSYASHGYIEIIQEPTTTTRRVVQQ